MDKALEVPLTLVSAAAGYGKSTLVCEWLQIREHSAAWLSLDETDSNLRQFLSYLVAAIEITCPGACSSISELLKAHKLPPLSDLVIYLSNELDDIQGPCIVVLDDYQHLGRSSPVHQLIDKLLLHPLPHVHIVLITRRDPPLLLMKMRANNHILEVRSWNLQFTEPETAELLAAALGPNISNLGLVNVHSEIEGWVAGLRLVVLTVRHTDKPDEKLKALHGGVSSLKEYIITEVLNNLPEKIASYLLKSTILNRLCAEVIEAICCPETPSALPELSGGEFIDRLKRENLFVASLDAEGVWFRYHHLFHALLQEQFLQQYELRDIEQLHERASNWFEGQNLIEEAIQHALKAKNLNLAAGIIERHYREQINQDRFYIVDDWINMLPEQIQQTRFVLLLSSAWIAVFRQQISQLSLILDKAESLFDDDEDNDGFGVELRFFRGYLNFWMGDTSQCEHDLEFVVASVSHENPVLLAEAEVHLSMARYMNSKKAIAIKGLHDRISEARGIVLSRVIGALSLVHLLSGDVYLAKLEGKRMRELAEHQPSALNTSWGFYLEGISNLHRMDIETAEGALIASSAYPYSTDARAAVDAFAGLALAQQLMEQPEVAAETVKQLFHFANASMDHSLIEVARSCEARIALLQGDLAKALEWATSASCRLDQLEFLFWVETPAITQCRVLIANGSAASLKKADTLLQDIRKLCEAWQFRCQIIEISVLQSLLWRKQGRQDLALASLREALDLAVPGGWVRPFVEIGRPLVDLLERLDGTDSELDFVRRVIASIGVGFAPSREIVPTTPKSPVSPMPHDLTNRELEILEMLTQRLQNKEIATKLFISTHTVNYHLKHIYQKLGVGNRRYAVKKAIELGVLPPT